MTHIALDRRFVVWDEKDTEDLSLYERMRHVSEGMTWVELAKHHRVVVLAEAGSGKTKELKEQARAKAETGEFSFYVTVHEVANDGLEGALSAEDQERLDAWRASAQSAYFYFDSVDEAKLDGLRLATALRKLSDGVRAAPRRAHIVFSGRITDWEFRADLNSFSEMLPIPAEAPPPEIPESTSILLNALRGEYRRPRRMKVENAEKPIVVLMAPLDKERIRAFAAAKGVQNLDAFIEAIGAGELWSFARRPMDLDWLVTYWLRCARFGSLAEMIDVSLQERVLESNPHHARGDPIETERAMRALERIGAALVFGRADKISIPDSDIELRPVSSGLRLDQVLPDWDAEHRRRLLTRAAFDPATFGHVRLHSDNEGVVRSFLAARWLLARRHRDCSPVTLRDLLFADIYGYPLVKPSLRSTAAWLALWDSDVAREIVTRDPLLLLSEGDPGSLSAAIRVDLLTAVVEQMSAAGEPWIYFPEEALRRFATGDLVEAIHRLWREYRQVPSCRTLLLRIITAGSIPNCGDIAVDSVFGDYTDNVTRILGGRTLVSIGDPALTARYAAYVLAEANALPSSVLWEGLEQLLMRGVSIEQFLAIITAMDESERADGFDHHGQRCLDRLTTRRDLAELLDGLILLTDQHAEDAEDIKSESGNSHFRMLAVTAERLVQCIGTEESSLAALEVAMRIRERDRHRSSDKQSQELIARLTETSKRRQIGFWYAAERFSGHKRERWAALTNEALRDAGIAAYIDHRSLAAQGIDREPLPRIPKGAFYAERRGGRSEIAERIREAYRGRVLARLERAKVRAAHPGNEYRLADLRHLARQSWLQLRRAMEPSQPKTPSASRVQERESVQQMTRSGKEHIDDYGL